MELLAIVWAVEHFKNYVYGVQFKVISDHKALMSVLKPNRGNKTFTSRLTRWVDRLLPFEFEVVHVAGRTLGMADYLSRHPTELEGASLKAEALWNEWFTVNSVISLKDVLEDETQASGQSESERMSLNRINQTRTREPIRKQDKRNSRESSKIHCAINSSKSSMSKNSAIKLPNEKLLPANYFADKTIQRVIAIVKNYIKTAVSRLPSPWREKFQLFSTDDRNFLYMDNRLVIPQSMRAMIMCSLHYGHPGRDAMLAMVGDIWWPRIHREVIDQARLCDQCLEAGKNLKCIQSQKELGKIPKTKQQNEEIALDFAGPFQNAREETKYLLVSIDHFSGWPDAKFLRCPTTKKVIEFLKHYIAQFEVPKKIRTDPDTVFVSDEFARFCRHFGIEHIICPVRDHRGNGKIERLIRTINERLRTNKQILVTKDQSGLSEILYTLRISKKKDGSSPFEKQWGREPNTVKSNLVSKLLDISEQDPDLQFDNSDFQDELDSTVLVRERARITKLQGAFDKKTGRKIEESAHTITLLPEGSKKPKTYAKRDLAVAIREQKEKFQKTNEPEKKKEKRAIIDSTSESETTENKMEKKKKQKKKPRLTVKVQIDNEEEMRPPVMST